MKTIDTAIILAGGRSLRMGFDKKLITVGNKFLLETLVDKLGEVFKNIIIVSNDKEMEFESKITVVEDEIRGIGPLGGIHAGLKNSNSDYNYFIACDMPYVNIDYINFMITKLENTNTCGLVTKYKEHIEPFNSFYSKKFVREIENHINSGKKSIYSLLKESEIIYIEEKVARQYSPNWEMFYNVNTIEDLNNII